MGLKRGRKENSEHVSKERIMKRMEEIGLKKASLARAIGYSREAVTKSINRETMDKEMLYQIAKVLDRYPSFLQGITDWEHSFEDYMLDTKWDNSTDKFRAWVLENKDFFACKPYDLPPHVKYSEYGFDDYYAENNPASYDENGNRVSDDCFDILASDTLDFIKQQVVDSYKYQSDDYGNDITLTVFNIPCLSAEQERKLKTALTCCVKGFLVQECLLSENEIINSDFTQLKPEKQEGE